MVTKSYRDSYERSVEQPEDFWLEAAGEVAWTAPPTRALDSSRAPALRLVPGRRPEHLLQRAGPPRRGRPRGRRTP